jgi:hypothetical protein
VSATGDPAAWRGADISDDTDWRYALAPADLAALVDIARALAEPVRTGTRPLTSLGPDAADVEGVRELTAAVRTQLLTGRGFALVRGLPAAGLDATENQVLYWLLGCQVGIPMHQNTADDVLVRVRDEGKNFEQLGVRAYETNANLDYHTDSSDVVALYCLRPAMAGGTSTIVSSAAVHAEMARRQPELVALLHAPWPQISPVGRRVSFEPICATSASGRLFTRYGRKYTELAVEHRPDVVPPLTEDQIAALDLFDAITREPGFVLNMDFQPGDVQFLNNYLIMHARTEYVDWPDEARRRELLRMWLVFREQFDLPAVFADAGFISRAAVFGAA